MNYLAKYAITAALAVTGTAATVAASSAMPLAPLATPAVVEQVAWGCGPGWHPNPWGRCVPNRVVVYPRYYYWHGPAYYAWHPHRHWHRWHRW
ncbi:hypothetical protein [Mesorhizobium sp. B2-1-3A]|uniref:GCG_CRPN prefix-to-repeats domain-containing protein n=1 Tax=Mesorhizobium sp. B2-1-3A TaxID=2589971 RepID=UPI001126D61F|nr:hypothetical protein [Mesorhizobium sp. B2-1-3A]TPM92898.1 hypothetical protein FJ977_28930 [Mesorhizobium sp. B2-1-3A]